MKKIALSMACLTVFCLNAVGQSARSFTLMLADRTLTSLCPASETDAGDQTAMLTCYLPSVPSGRAVVCCPGGGYTHLAMQHEGHEWADFFTSKGIAFFVLKYRMPHGDRSLPMNDAFEAIRLVRDSADVWRLNPREVGIMGSSAGGHLASAVSTHAPSDVLPDFTILFYPVISMNEPDSHRGSVVNFLGDGRTDGALVEEFSSDCAVRAGQTPPAIILASADDGAVPPVTNGVAYFSAMQLAGNRCTLHLYPTGGHGWGIRPNFAHHEQMIQDLNYWLAGLKL